MRRFRRFSTGLLALGLASAAYAQTFTYQGALKDGGAPASGAYNMHFSLFDDAGAGTQVGNSITQNGVGVAEGLFTSELNFGPAAFNGAARWLEISVNGTPLSPRSNVTAAPMAIFAMKPWETSGTSISYSAGNVGIGTSSPWINSKLDIRGGDVAVGDPALIVGARSGFEGERSITGLWSTFENIPMDTTARRTADIVAGFNSAAWGTEYLALNVGNNGSANDVAGLTSEKLRITANGNVGIGTAEPQARLAVNGDAIVNGAVTASSFVGDGSGLTGIGSAWSQTGTGISYAAGNVGIGTSNPTAALHVNGGVRVNGANFLEMGAGVAKEPNAGKIGYQLFTPGSLDIVGAGATGSERKVRVWAEGGTSFAGSVDAPAATILTLTTNYANIGMLAGPIGIDTQFPMAMLQVAGDFRATGTVTIDPQDSADEGGELVLRGAANHTNWVVDAFADRIRFIGDGAEVASIKPNGELTANVVTILGGSDVAEPYEVAAAADVLPAPGLIVSIDPNHIGQMRVASDAYDKTVAGILSGANGIAPGITLRQKGTVADGTHPVASIGRVWCWCDSDANGPIAAGDMLTTSNTPGHGMKVSDFDQANGSVIGKAMSPLASGRGLVLVLVSLK